MKVCFETFGCRLNKAEALEMEAEYLAAGWELTSKHSEADLFVVRGCSVTARAQRDCERLIAHLKRHYPSKGIRICGCLSSKLKNSYLGSPVNSALQDTGEVKDLTVPTRTARAYLKVQDGCSGKCTFCIVPQFRGTSVSVPFDEILDKAKRFIDAGYKEIVVTGCNLALYASQGKRLPELVSALATLAYPPSAAIPCQPSFSVPRIRLGSLEPGACALETVAAMSEHVNVCRFLHIPVQSGSDHILAAMRRPYLAQDVDKLAAEAIKRMPNLGLGCDLMTGFPGEAESDFAATCGLIRRLPFNLAHVFPYSERPGTWAAGVAGAVPKPRRSSRAHRIADIVAEKRFVFARRFFGREVEIVCENDERTVGWTSEYLRCRCISPVPRKEMARILVTKIHRDASLEGKLIDGSALESDANKGSQK